MSQALLPSLTRSRGAIVNVLSVVAFAALPIVPAYSISKAAAFSLSQSLRALLAGRGVSVHAVLTGPWTPRRPGIPCTEGVTRVGRASCLRRSDEWRRRDFHRSYVDHRGRKLATVQSRSSNVSLGRSSQRRPSRHERSKFRNGLYGRPNRAQHVVSRHSKEHALHEHRGRKLG